MRLAIFLFLALIFITPAFAQNNDMRSLMGRMDQLQRQMDTVSRQVYNGNPPEGALSKPAAGGDNAGLAAAMDERMSGLEGSLKQITNRLDEQDYAVGQLKQQFELYKNDMEVRLKEMSTQAAAKPAAASDSVPATGAIETPQRSSSKDTPDTNAQTAAMADPGQAGDVQDMPDDSATALYDASFQALREQKYDRAEAGFKEFLQKYKTDALAGNAQYWLGETYYVRAKYDDAAKVFAQGYKNYPKSSKGPDNLLKLGLSLAQSGKKDAACVTLQQLGTQYPTAAAVIKQRADDERKKLACPNAG